MGLLDVFRKKSGSDAQRPQPVVQSQGNAPRTEGQEAGDWATAEDWRGWEPPLTFVVGEARRQEALWRVAGKPRPGGWLVPVEVGLHREPGNRFDANAIQVNVGGSLVGYVDKEAAAEIAPAMDVRRINGVDGLPGLIRGGWPERPNLGVLVWLDDDLRRTLDDVDWDYIADEFECQTWPPREEEGVPRLADAPTSTGRHGQESDARVGPPRLPPLTAHYTSYVEDVKELKRQKRLEDAERLLLVLLDETEKESAEHGVGVAPWYYEQLAVVRRKARNFTGEVEVLERFARQKHAPGVAAPKLLKRLADCRSRTEDPEA